MKNMRRKLLSLLLVMAMVCSMVPSALAAGTGTGSGGSGTGTPGTSTTVTGVTLDTKSLTLTLGSTTTGTLTATVAPAGATNQSVSWSSSDTTVATVTATSGNDKVATVNALKAGTTTITVTTVDGSKTDTCNVTVNAAATQTISLPGTLALTTGGAAKTLTASVPNAGTGTYYIMWTATGAGIKLGTSANDLNAGASIKTAHTASVYVSADSTATTGTITATLHTDSACATTALATSNACAVTATADATGGYTLRLAPASGTSSFGSSVPVNYNYYGDNWYNDYYYNGYRDFGVVPVLYDSNNRQVTSGTYTISGASYTWSLKGYTIGTSASSNLYSTYSGSNTGSTARIYARDVYNYSSSSTTNLTCHVSATVTINNTQSYSLSSSTSSNGAYWTVYPGTYYNTGSISAAATVYANSTGYSLGSTDDAGSTSIVSELQSAVSSRYGYGNSWSDRFYYDSSTGYYVDRYTGEKYSSRPSWWGDWDYGWNGYGYDTLRYVTFSSVSATGGSLSASTGTRYYVGGRSSYGSSALENVVFTPNGKASTASFNITAYGDYGTYSGTITFNMSGSATPTTLTMSGTAGQNLNFKTSDFTSWWRGMYPSGNLSYVRFTSCSTGSLTNGVNGSSVVGNNTSCYASASGSQVAIGNLIYNSGSTAAATVTVNFTGYGSTTGTASASTNRAGTLTITLAAGTPTVVSNLNVSYSCGTSGVQLNATTFYNAVSASVSTASYITLGSPSSGTLTQNGVNVTSGSRFVLSGTSNNIGDVLYKPAANFNGTATIPFVAYNSNNQTVATGTISIAVTQATTPTTPAKTFPDITGQYAWAAQYISALSSAGVVGGYDDGKFHPERNVTYGEALKLILLAAGYPEQAQGSGTNWAVNYLTLAINNQILPGSASSYTLSAAVDRNTIAAMTAKALKLSPVTDTSSSPFVDSKDPYVLALNKAGIIFGDSSSGAAYYQGDKSLTRAEVSAIIYRINNYRG